MRQFCDQVDSRLIRLLGLMANHSNHNGISLSNPNIPPRVPSNEFNTESTCFFFDVFLTDDSLTVAKSLTDHCLTDTVFLTDDSLTVAMAKSLTDRH